MRGGFRARKKTLKQAGWQVVDESKAGDREYELVLQKSDGDQKIFKAKTRARAYMRAEQELLVNAGAHLGSDQPETHRDEHGQ